MSVSGWVEVDLPYHFTLCLSRDRDTADGGVQGRSDVLVVPSGFAFPGDGEEGGGAAFPWPLGFCHLLERELWARGL